MVKLTAKSAATQAFLPLMQELSEAYQAFSLYDAEGLRKSGSDLTPSQARVVFTLGDTDGMTCKDIGDITLITKGTLTGVVDRLEEKGLVERWAVEGDGRIRESGAMPQRRGEGPEVTEATARRVEDRLVSGKRILIDVAAHRCVGDRRLSRDTSPEEQRETERERSVRPESKTRRSDRCQHESSYP